MATELPQNVETELPVVPAPVPEKVESLPKVEEEKPVLPLVDDTKALAVVEKTPDSAEKKTSEGSHDRDVALAELEKEKRLSFIKAWEESEKSKVENKNQKQLASVNSWENTQKANIEAKLKKIEEDMDKKKAAYAEQMNNKIAMVHKAAEEKRAMVEAKRGEDLLKAEEMAAKHRATGYVPKKVCGCFGG
ncbi:Remorin [Heracleum sosnowskyi]|uniref:Remorin n=1 Tax=Heracleum sosnowskyi TaxID=360622 RepID=A0AAD8I215_9APIA|nr:Remorin [Heracleum sosnowskyi]